MDTATTGFTHRHIDIDQLKRGRWQPRRLFDQEKLQELADSIDQVGIVEPLVVRFDKRDGKFEIVAGERRWRAAQVAMLSQVPVIIRDDLDDQKARLMALIENVQREDLNPIEEAEGLRDLVEQCNLTHKEAGQRTGKSRSYISNTLRLLELDETVKNWLREGKLETGHAKHLLTLAPRIQADLARMAVRFGWSVRQIGKRAEEMKELARGKIPDLNKGRDPNLLRLERLICEKYGMPVRIDYDDHAQKGRVEIDWYSLEELQGLLDAWGLSVD